MFKRFISLFFLILIIFALPLNYATAKQVVDINTSLGVISLELYDEKAPITVANFMKYVDGGYYNKMGNFYRVVRSDNDHGTPIIEVIQGGLSADDMDLPFPTIMHEDTEQTGITHLDGTISMARGPVGTAGDAFFITIGAQPSLDKGGMRNPDGQGFAAFGRVIEGMDVVRAIQSIKEAKKDGDAYVEGQILTTPIRFTISKHE